MFVRCIFTPDKRVCIHKHACISPRISLSLFIFHLLSIYLPSITLYYFVQGASGPIDPILYPSSISFSSNCLSCALLWTQFLVHPFHVSLVLVNLTVSHVCTFWLLFPCHPSLHFSIVWSCVVLGYLSREALGLLGIVVCIISGV